MKAREAGEHQDTQPQEGRQVEDHGEMHTRAHRGDEHEEDQQENVPLLLLASHSVELRCQGEKGQMDQGPQQAPIPQRYEVHEQDGQIREPDQIHGPGGKRCELGS